MNSVEEISTYKQEYIERCPRNSVNTAATTYDFPEQPPKKEKKWSFGNLFRRKKKDESDSSSEDEVQRKKKRKQDKRRKLVKGAGGFDHIVVPPQNNRGSFVISNGYNKHEDTGVLSEPSGNFGSHVGRPLPRIPVESKHERNESVNSSNSPGSLDSTRKSRRDRAKARVAARRNGSSSDEDSQRSYSSSRFRSDESLSRQRDSSLSRKSRIARTERYIRRLSKDDESILNREALQRQARENWQLKLHEQRASPESSSQPNFSGLFTIPPSHSNHKYRSNSNNSQEVEHSPNTNCFSIRSLSCDSNIHKSPSPEDHPEIMHVQFPIGRPNRNRNVLMKQPPPPPPRDPRRVAAAAEIRPASHSFDKMLHQRKPNFSSHWHAGYRTASEDHIPTEPRQPLAPRPASVTNETRQPRYIKRHVQESADRFQYLTEKKPRSRKPIFIQSNDKINSSNFNRGKQADDRMNPSSFNEEKKIPSFNQRTKSSSFNEESYNQHTKSSSFNEGESLNQFTKSSSLNRQTHSPGYKFVKNEENFNQTNSSSFNRHVNPSSSNHNRRSSSFNEDENSSNLNTLSSNEDRNPLNFNQQRNRRSSSFNDDENSSSVNHSSSLNRRFNLHTSPSSFNHNLKSSSFKQQIHPLNFNDDNFNQRFNVDVDSSNFNRLTIEDKTSPSFNQYIKSSSTNLNQHKNPVSFYQQTNQHIASSNKNVASFNQQANPSNFNHQTANRTDSQNSLDFWKRKELENSRPSSKSTSSSPQMFTAQTHVQTKIFLPSVLSNEPDSTDTVDFIKRNSSPFKPISSPSPLDKKREITSSADSLSGEFRTSEEVRRKSANLEEALDELEAIYKSLHLGDEDLLERAEQRENTMATKAFPTPRGALSDSSFSYEPYNSIESPKRKKVLKKSQTLDRRNDDMAYRKLNKDRANTISNPQSVLAGVSYLLTSPVHCPQEDAESLVDPNDEPDVTLDDVVYRSIKHANNSLKVVDPQPPFGIPIGTIAPAPNSDYLHAVPENEPRYNFKHKKMPDVVKDDLAFRNLRKDCNKEPALDPDYSSAHRKKRAVRSLSANIGNIMHRDDGNFENEFSKNSLTDIADAMEIARQILKEKEDRIACTKRAFLSDSETKYRKAGMVSASSTETITESRLNFLNEMRTKDAPNYLHAKPPRGASPARRQSKESTPVPVSPETILEDKPTSFEDLLTALAVEARETSDRITNELNNLDDDLSKCEEDLTKRLSDIDAVSEHAKMCEKLLECVVESTELISSTKTDEEVEQIDTVIPESVANIVTTRTVEEEDAPNPLDAEVHSASEPDYENLGSDTDNKSPFEEHKSELIATFKELNVSSSSDKDEAASEANKGGRRNRRRAKRNSSQNNNTSCGNSSDMSETPETRADRMARYKEERRRQLAAQFNETTSRLISKEGSSSSSEGPRMTRTARLRAAANSSPSTPSRIDAGKEPRSSPASSLASHGDLPRRQEKEKDKSSKRKSNLNRSLTSEEVAIDINDDSKNRRRRRRFFPPEVLQQSLNTSSNEDKQKSDASLTANNMSPLSSPITAITTTPKSAPRRSELSIHMENARKGVTAPFSSLGKSRSSPKRGIVSPKERSPRLQSDGETHFFDKDFDGNWKQSNKENVKRKTDDVSKSITIRCEKNKVPNANNDSSPDTKVRTSRFSRRLDELTALTRDTLARVERIANKTRESPKKEADGNKKNVTTRPKMNGVAPAKPSPTPKVVEDLKNSDSNQSLPVSILKRKVSQDESKSMVTINTPPVTFSPNVIEPTSTKRKQGILKKRRSLDESQVLRHRSCSPDMASKSDSKSILKNQRRSSLEEITHLTSDSNLQSILKRKTSRCEEELDNSLNSPQGILKRRSGASSAGSTTSTHHHVSITTAVILAAAEGAEMILDNNNETVKPILKKKSISDEGTNGESDNLKPILKKKSSTDTDDGEDRPKRPILKLSRSMNDGKDSNDFSRYSANESGSECEVRPILKSSSKEETPRPRLSFCADDDISLPDDDEEHFSRRRTHRRSLQNEFLSLNNSTGSRELERDVTRPRVVSVSELVMNFEKSTGAIPKKSSFKRNSDRCRTQPITINEFEASLSYMQSPQLEDFPRLAQSSPSANTAHSSHSLLDLGNAERLSTYFSTSLPITSTDCGTKMSSDSAFQSLGDGLELEQENRSVSSKVNAGIQRHKNKGSLGVDRASYSRYPTQPVTLDEVQEAAKINAEVKSGEQNAEPDVDEPDPSKLSFSERIKLFTKKQAEEKLQNLDVQKRRLRSVTQPITPDEVETARFLNNDKPTLSPYALGNETFADRRGILKSKLDFSANRHREKSRSPPPRSALKRGGLEYVNPSLVLKKDPTDFTYDEGISSNDSESDSEVKIVVTDSSENGKCVSASKKSNRYVNGSDHTSDESSGGREIQSIIGREALAKRRQMRERLSSDGYITKSRSHANVGNDSDLRPSSTGVRRSNTTAAMPRATIGELQAKLQQSGDNDWRKRLPKLNNASEELNLLNVKNLYNDKLSEKSSILEAKKDELDASARQWKSRVEKSDANEFSVAGRMQIKDIPSVPINIPTIDKVRRTPKAKRFKGKEGDDIKDTSSTPVSPDIDESLGFKRSVSVPTNSTDDSSGSESSLRSSARKVAVFRPDDDTFKSFFKSVDAKKSEEHVEVSLDAFDSVTRQTESLLVSKKNIKVQRRKATSRNPVKALAARVDIQNEYTEIITGVAERETKRLNIEKFAKNSTLAVEALAGLASKEDFASIALKKSSSTPNISYLPFTNLMLLHVKGRRHVQTRLVEPVASSINTGDNYVLITPNALYHYIGAYSNVIEQSRAADIINHIQQSGDMGCKVEKSVSINAKKSVAGKDSEKFWQLLGAKSDVAVTGAGHPDEDEVYESTIVDTNMIYCVENKELVPLEEYWGKIPKIEMLQPSRVLVFDYGSEMYVWSGKNADPEEKKIALKLAKELWYHGYNYSECAVCPLTVANMIGDRMKSPDNLISETRPDWALFSKITQHRETILFREKFLDWPDYSRVIKVKGNDQEKSNEASFEIKPCDVNEFLNSEYVEPDLTAEGSHLGRGKSYYDSESNRNFEINTLDVTCWVTLENTYEKLESECFGHFYDCDSYIVRWQFRVTITGRELSGKPSKHAQLGRDRCIYFCWLGKNASINEKGAAALLTVELDSEHAKQIRVTQGSEPPAFLQLFDGKMFIHSGKRDAEKEPTRLYISRGEIVHETVLIEVPCSMRSLRSRTSFVFIEPDKVTIWNGSKSLGQTRAVTASLAEYIRTSKPCDFNFTSSGDVELSVIEEGDEKDTFLCELEKRQLYNSLVKSGERFEATPRMFYFNSISGVFEAAEILCPHRSLYTTPYPFLQIDLYSANQPALFLIDNGHELWLWQGWWPDRENDSELSEQTGSGAVRWQAERRAAMQTAIDYWHAKHSDAKSVPAYLVWAGLEPLSFTNLFPVWCDRDDIAELNIKEGKKAGDKVLVEKELALLTRTTYPLAELLQRPLPDGVDPTHLEKYLSTDDFTHLLSMTLEEFNKLPAWKQTALKKERGLF